MTLLPRPTLSLVLPIYNEEDVIPELHRRLQDFLAKLPLETEVLFVNDGSRDRSMELLRDVAEGEARYRILSFARNFGHQTAITAGVDYARGKAVVVMDADLQDPPEVVLEMVARWREGFDVVYGRRRKRQGETWFKLLTARWFYRVFAAMIPNEVPLDTGDFRLMSRRVIVALRELRETHRFVRGMVAWIGFKQTEVLYDRPGRFAGETKYPLRKMVRFAVDGITLSLIHIFGEHLLGLFVTPVLDELLREDATAIQVFLPFGPVLLEAAQQVVQTDRDGASLLVLHLNRGPVEAQELPHLFHHQRDRSVDDLLLEGRAVGLDGQKNESVAGHAVREGRYGSENGSPAPELNSRSATGRGYGLLAWRIRHEALSRST